MLMEPSHRHLELLALNVQKWGRFMPKLPSADFLHRLADVADRETLPRFRTDLAVDSKSGERYFDPVTEADREAEIAIRAVIMAEYPDHAILGEELGQTGSGRYRWVLDPVDGTRPFICGLPVWGTLIGLTVDGRAEMGMMSQPFTGERFWATADGAWRERAGKCERLSTRDVGALSRAILHTTGPEHYHGELKQGFDRLAASVRMTRYGGECYAHGNARCRPHRPGCRTFAPALRYRRVDPDHRKGRRSGDAD
jgi:histidinol phosphatase-like enzyme (inositol monophosphatase family)